MNAPLIVQDLVASLQRRYGKCESFGRSRLFKFASSFACSINYSKLLGGHRFFFGVSREVVDAGFSFPQTTFGDFVLLVCGDVGHTLVLPRQLVIEMLTDVATRRIDIFNDNGSYVLQTTRHPKLNATEFLNAFPKQKPAEAPVPEDGSEVAPDRIHVKMQWALIQLGRAEGCSVWVPPNDRNLSFKREPLAANTLDKLPNFGFEENTRRIVQNIDVLWLKKNVIRKAFEVESTTSIYSGLLRLNDLVLAQPNNQIDLYIVASRNRRERVQNQLIRPSFQQLLTSCRFVDFESVETQLDRLQTMRLDKGVRVSGLIEGEQFSISDHFDIRQEAEDKSGKESWRVGLQLPLSGGFSRRHSIESRQRRSMDHSTNRSRQVSVCASRRQADSS